MQTGRQLSADDRQRSTTPSRVRAASGAPPSPTPAASALAAFGTGGDHSGGGSMCPGGRGKLGKMHSGCAGAGGCGGRRVSDSACCPVASVYKVEECDSTHLTQPGFSRAMACCMPVDCWTMPGGFLGKVSPGNDLWRVRFLPQWGDFAIVIPLLQS